MNEKKIINIVKFAVTDEVGDSRTVWNQAAVFYEDGSVEILSMDDAISLAKSQNIIMRLAMANHLMNNYRDYMVPKEKKKARKNFTTEFSDYEDLEEKPAKENIFVRGVKKIGRGIKKFGQGILKGVALPFVGIYKAGASIARFVDKHFIHRDRETLKAKRMERKQKRAMKRFKKDNRNYAKTGKRPKFFRRFGKRLVACATALGVLVGVAACANEFSNENKKTAKEIEITTDNLDQLTDDQILQLLGSGTLTVDQIKQLIADGRLTNDQFEQMTFQELLDVTTNKTQKAEMTKVGNYIDYFNGTFADDYLESSHSNIRAALSWGEVNALNLAYNNFTDEEIKAIFNGYEVDSYNFTNYYKEATLQLMGAFVIEDRDMPVGLDQLLNTEEGKALYQDIHELFLKAKETTGQEQLDAVNAFYQAIYDNFAIEPDIREVGISHAESRDDMVSYKLAITPMVAASEMMFQNLEIDYTLSDKVIDYFNDLGLCEYAQGTFDEAERITENCGTKEDEKNPTYEQFMYAKVKELTKENHYFVSDRNRDLSQLDSFQKWVNGHFSLDKNGEFSIGESISDSIVVKTYSTSSTSYHTETTRTETSDRNEAIRLAGIDAVVEAEAKVDAQLEKENQQLKEQGYQEAAKKKEELQQEADEAAEDIRDEIKQDDEDFQNKVDDANDQLGENNKDQNPSNDNPVNEDDFGDHDVDFDDEYSDENGNLEDSVGDITNNGDGAGEDFPDPGESGDEFDQNSPEYGGEPPITSGGGNSGGNSSDSGSTATDSSVGTTPSGDTFYEYEEPVAETPENYAASNEAIADAMVEEMANQSEVSGEAAVQYTYTNANTNTK